MRILALILLSVSLYAGSPFRCPYTVTSEFGDMEGKGGERRIAGHMGIDLIPTTWDWIIFPVLPGEVVDIGIDPVYGKFVIISHGEGLETLYAHAETIFDTADIGCIVTTETPIFKMGSTGYSDGPHLHLEARLNGIAVDPKEYIK